MRFDLPANLEEENFLECLVWKKKKKCICSTGQVFLRGMFISNVPLPSRIVSLNQGYKMILLREPSQVWSKKAIYFHWPSWSSEFRFSSLAHLRIKHCHHACNYSLKVISRKEHWKGNRLSLAILYFSIRQLARWTGSIYFHVIHMIKTLSVCFQPAFLHSKPPQT